MRAGSQHRWATAAGSPPPPNFDRVAAMYRWAEHLALGPLLQRTRTHFLPRPWERRRALLLGDGDGRFLAKLLAQNPALCATAADLSPRMLELLRRRALPHLGAGHGRLQTIAADAIGVSAPPDTDLIVTHFFLDCLHQPAVEKLVRRLTAETGAGTLWLLSDFSVPQGAVRPFARAYVRLLYLAFRLLTGLRPTSLPDPQTALRGAGWTLAARHTRLFGILYTELWQHP